MWSCYAQCCLNRYQTDLETLNLRLITKIIEQLATGDALIRDRKGALTPSALFPVSEKRV